jgi:hypothetical protein
MIKLLILILMEKDTRNDLIADWIIGILLVISTIGLIKYLADHRVKLKQQHYEFKAIKLPETINQYDSVYVDPTTVGTTTDPK